MNLENLARVIRQTVEIQINRYPGNVTEKEIVRLIQEEMAEPHPKPQSDVPVIIVVKAKKARTYPAKKVVKRKGLRKKK